jgi:hypothetical protein
MNSLKSIPATRRCPFTGIPYHFILSSEVPSVLSLDNLQLKESVLSLTNAISLASQTNETLSQLSNSTLAGIFLLLYSSKQLLVYKANPIIVNDMVASSEQTTLIQAIQLFPQINKFNLNSIPQRDLDPKTYADCKEKNFEAFLKDFVESVSLAVLVKSKDNPVNDAMVRIRGAWTPPVLGKNEISPWTKSDHEINFAKEYHNQRIRAKNALTRIKYALISLNFSKLANVLNTAVGGNSLLTASEEVRNRLYERLTEVSRDLPDSFQSSVDVVLDFITMSMDKNTEAVKLLNLGLDNASHSFTSNKPMSLAERLAKAKEKQNE